MSLLHAPDPSEPSSTADAPGPFSADQAGPQPAVGPAGPRTLALWQAGQETAAAIAGSPFVRALLEGTLSEDDFSFYLAQDAHYLRGYSRALAALSARCDDPGDQLAWIQSAAQCLTEEAELHRAWLSQRPGAADLSPSPVTAAYMDFLLATTLGQDRSAGVAAVLPCYWLYAQVAAALPAVAADHPYAAWLETYRDPEFLTAARGALERVERELEAASPDARAAAERAYLRACRHELEFFDQALHRRSAQPDARTAAAPAERLR